VAGVPLLLSLCMIVKNEEKNIARCLDSIKNIVDEIVIIDTGSTDQTIQKAKEFGAKIYRFPWSNDFSAARNQALRKTKGQWILILDADESLEMAEVNRLRQTLRAAKEEGFYLSIYNYQGEDPSNYTRTYGLRLFRNNPLYRYAGKIHEQILPAIKKADPKALIAWSPLVIHHYGYLKDTVTAKDKAGRNLEILLRESPDVKDSSSYCLNLALEYIRLGKLLEAEIKLKEGWKKVNRKDSYAHCLLLKLIACLHWQKKDTEAIPYCRQGIEIYPDFADIYYYYAICLLKMGDSAEARNVLRRGLHQGESHRKYISHAGCGSYLNLLTLGQIEEQDSNFEIASDYYLRALQLQPQHLPYLKCLIRVLLKCELDIKPYLAKNNLLSREYVLTIVQTAYTLSHYSLVLEILSDWEDADGDWELRFIQGKSLMRLGQYQEALANLNTIPQQSPLPRDIFIYSWLCSILIEDFRLAASYSAKLKDHDDKLSKLLAELQHILQYGFKTDHDGNHAVFKNNESVQVLLEIIDNLAACQAEKFIKPMIAFMLHLTGEDFKPLLLKILAERHCYHEAIDLFKRYGKEAAALC